ncbi:hypothetical protein CCACVL1_02666 [Corchorus capsularis]|uniref:Uncharacterized protein n=1 Tax=Corchorus capsularis TaxID=210143 RepID=A0A1R3K745_COCAP|nr:hypothetical protein CCACVL1_02666 [Corchorus capsularis]
MATMLYYQCAGRFDRWPFRFYPRPAQQRIRFDNDIVNTVLPSKSKPEVPRYSSADIPI